MDDSNEIIKLLKDESIKVCLNPVAYYGLKSIYDRKFINKSPLLSSALKIFFESLGSNLNISIFDESIIQNDEANTNNKNDNYLETTNMSSMVKEIENIQINNDKFVNDNNLDLTLNKDNYNNVSMLFNKDWSWALPHLLKFNDEYILNKDDSFILVNLIKTYLFSDDDPMTCQLMVSYNIFVTSVELIFCLSLVENLPEVIYDTKNKILEKSANGIIKRVHLFYSCWSKMYNLKYESNIFIQTLIKDKISSKVDEKGNFLDLTTLSMFEPQLTNKYVSFTKLLREGLFCFEIEEVARQICIIDHEYMSHINIDDYNKFIHYRIKPPIFNKISIRKKQFRCYMLLFILMQNTIENKRNIIQNFILLALTCKMLNNYQTSYTIVKTLNKIELSKKKLLWNMIDKKSREIYSNLDKAFNEVEVNTSNNIFDPNEIKYPFVPHYNRIKGKINEFIITSNSEKKEDKDKLSKGFKDYYIVHEGLVKNRYSFFKVNPLYDFLKFGFLELFKPKKWNLKKVADLSQYIEKESGLDQLFELLTLHFKKLDN